MTAVTDLKRTHRATWAAGNYASIAELIDEAPPRDLLARVEISPGKEVLDVATGTGNVAIRAAASGARVVGLDLTSELFEAARERAAERGVVVDWVEGDAEELPFEDESLTACSQRSAFSSRRATRSSRASWCVSAGPADSSASSTGPRHNPWRFDSADRERLTAEGRWEQCRDELLAMAERRNEATDGSLLMNAEYLVVIGRRAG